MVMGMMYIYMQNKTHLKIFSLTLRKYRSWKIWKNDSTLPVSSQELEKEEKAYDGFCNIYA